MPKRLRYTAEHPAPIRMEYKQNGAYPTDPRMTSQEAADSLGIPKRTLVRWWRRLRFPPAPPELEHLEEPYDPDEEWKGDQMRLLWPVVVVDRIRELLEATDSVKGIPGMPRLPKVEWKAATKW